MRVVKQITKYIGPIFITALSLFISFQILQPIAIYLNPSFNLLSNRGIGKIAFIFLVIYQIFLFLITLSNKFFQNFLKINFYFFSKKDFIKKFFLYFFIFSSIHAIILLFIFLGGFASYNPEWGKLTIKLIYRILFGFIATFFLAWTEELIFRGTLYPYFVQYIKPLPSVIITSVIFMFVHNITNPIILITSEWKLGLGLLLLGILLNLIFIDTKKLYTGIGLHAGIVFVKVILRRAPFLVFLSSTKLPFWLSRDLRQSNLVHILFVIAIAILIIKNKKELFKNSNI